MNPPVYLEGEGALLPDGRFVPETALKTAVDAVMALCAWIESLPPQVRIVLDLEAAFAEMDQS